MSIPSTLRTRPAPLEIHTENFRVLRPARRSSAACLYLRWKLAKASDKEEDKKAARCIPSISENSPVKSPEQKVKAELLGRKLLTDQLDVCRRAHDEERKRGS